MRRQAGFTLVELLTATTILMMLLGIVFLAINETGKIWRRSSDQIEAYQDARAAFETMTRKLGQATLNTYYDYFDGAGKSAAEYAVSGTSGNFTPNRYGRQSELHFVVGSGRPSSLWSPKIPAVSLPGGRPQVTHSVFFQAPLGQADNSTYQRNLNSLLNACGYFVVFTDNKSDSSLSGRPDFLDVNPALDRYRYCLMELSQPAENLSIYPTPPNSADWFKWFTTPLLNPAPGEPPQARVLAENIIALIVLPKETDAEEADLPPNELIGRNYEYSSRTQEAWSRNEQPKSMNQLPPVLKVVMIAIDENSARRMQGSSTSPPPEIDDLLKPLFKTADNLDADLKRVEAGLTQLNVNYRVFQTEIPMRSSKWTTQ